MRNVKISELPYASKIDDDALVVLVQDHANKVVTVDELSQKINEKQNHTIDHLWNELRRATGMETVRAISNTVSNHEYRIDGIEKLNGKQDRQLASLTNAMREISARQHAHHDDINILQTGVKENRRSLAYLNFRVDGVIKDTYTYFNNINQIQSDLAAEILKNKTIVASKDESGITIEKSNDDAGTTTYTVGLDQSVIVDGKTIVTDGGKLKTAVKLIKKYCADKTPTVDSKFFDTKEDVIVGVDVSKVHPVILLTNNAGDILDIVDGNEFVTDGMLNSVSYDDIEGTLTFTWNTDSGKTDTTTIDVHKLFNIEGIHTTTPDYIEVKQEKVPFEDNGTGTEVNNKMEYHVSAKVDSTDLKTFSSVTYTPATKDTDANYATNYTNDDALATATGKISGLADANKVATKIAQIDKDIVAVGNEAIAREKSIGEGINDKIQKLREALNKEIANLGDIDTKLYGEPIPETGPTNTIKKNADAIATLNADENTAGSVAAKIKALKDSLDAEIEYKDANNLIKVAVSQVDGVVTAKENAVTVNTATLTVNVDQDAEYTLATASPSGYTKAGGYKAKGIGDIAADDPSLVTNQDAWIYGQCIKTQAINAISSEDNEYIKIVREDNKTKIKFEPWTEVHTIGELEKIDEI